MSFFGVTTNVILPIVLIIGLAALIAWRLKPDPRPLSSVSIYLFTPFLVFDGMAHANIQPGEFGQLALLTVLLVTVLFLMGLGVSRLLKLNSQTESALLLTVILINAANYGLPINEFAYGPAGVERAMVYYVLSIVIVNTVGVFLASRGSASPRQALMNMFKVPLLYGMVLGLIVNIVGYELPLPLERVVSLLSDAAVPLMMVVLGIHLTRARIRGNGVPILAATGLRLIVSPLVAAALVALIGIPGLTGKVAIVQSGMPTAIMAGVLAAEFNSDAEFTASVTLVSTLLSVLTLNVLITVLG